MQKMMDFLRRQEGGTAIEYALVAVLVSLAAITVMIAIGAQVMALYGTILSGFLR